MQVGADGGGRRHGVGQPEVKRKLRRLGKCAEQDQNQCQIIERMAFYHRPRLQNVAEREAAGNVPEEQNPRKQCKPAAAGHQ